MSQKVHNWGNKYNKLELLYKVLMQVLIYMGMINEFLAFQRP